MPEHASTGRVAGEQVTGGLSRDAGTVGYRIDGLEHLEPFLTTVVSDTDLWMFVSSTGALTAGRTDADHAIFPYLTDDRIHRSVGASGPLTVVARPIAGERQLWRPFAAQCDAACSRSIFKSTLGDTLVLEERHREWELTFRAIWSPSSTYGWVRDVEIRNDGPIDVQLQVLDGVLDVMPAGVDKLTEQTRSNLVDAYKRSETGPWGTAAIYSLESLITDRAEPGEALAATVVWSTGFASATPSLRTARRRPRVRRATGSPRGSPSTTRPLRPTPRRARPDR